MAKQQSFESKVKGKSSTKKNIVKFIRSQVSKDKQSIRFSEEMVVIPDGKSIEEHLKAIVSNKLISTFNSLNLPFFYFKNPRYLFYQNIVFLNLLITQEN